MKKIPTLFERVYEGDKVVGIKNIITPGCEQVLLRGIPTIKYDDSCCAIIDGKFYKRYNCKKRKNTTRWSHSLLRSRSDYWTLASLGQGK